MGGGFPFDREIGLGDGSLMQNLCDRARKLKANSFTLVELLVVISIIGLLAGLAVPAIQGGLDRAKQQVDVSNVRQCGLIAFSYANDNDGNYNGSLTNVSSSLQYFTNLISMGLLNSPKVLSGNGYTAATSTNNISAQNVAWAYVSGLTTSDDGQIPLFLSKGISTLSSNVSLSSVTTGWKTKGAVVYRVGNSAEFLKAGAGGAPQGSINLGLSTAATNRVIQ